MAVVTYHVHFARPENFAAKDMPILRLILLIETEQTTELWMWRNGCWGKGRLWKVDPAVQRELNGR